MHFLWRAGNNREQRKGPQKRCGWPRKDARAGQSAHCVGGKGSEPFDGSEGKNGVTQSLSHTNPVVRPSDGVPEACSTEASSGTAPVSRVSH